MRKITQNAANAFIAGRPFASGNTTVTINSEGYIAMYLHGNLIARRPMLSREVEMTLAGWPTVTTRERLNGLCQSYGLPSMFGQRDFEQYFGHPMYADGKDRQIFDSEWVGFTA